MINHLLKINFKAEFALSVSLAGSSLLKKKKKQEAQFPDIPPPISNKICRAWGKEKYRHTDPQSMWKELQQWLASESPCPPDLE